VLNIRIPPLRERIEDLKILSQYFIDTISASLGIKSARLSENELALLSAHHWPGNVRELKNVIERSLLLNTPASECISGTKQNISVNRVTNHGYLLEDIEKHHILKVLDMENGNKSAAARILGVSRKTLERKVSAWAKAM